MRKTACSLFVLAALALVACPGGSPTSPIGPTPTPQPTPNAAPSRAQFTSDVSNPDSNTFWWTAPKKRPDGYWQMDLKARVVANLCNVLVELDYPEKLIELQGYVEGDIIEEHCQCRPTYTVITNGRDNLAIAVVSSTWFAGREYTSSGTVISIVFSLTKKGEGRMRWYGNKLVQSYVDSRDKSCEGAQFIPGTLTVE